MWICLQFNFVTDKNQFCGSHRLKYICLEAGRISILDIFMLASNENESTADMDFSSC